MSFYQYRPAGTGANDYTLAWDFDWTSPSHITTLNNDPAYNTPPAALGDTSAILLASGFGFTVPAGATIDAVTVEAYARQTGPANAAYQSLLKLYSGDVFIGDSKATAAYLPAAYTWLSWSGNLVYWNTPLTAAEVTAAALTASADVATWVHKTGRGGSYYALNGTDRIFTQADAPELFFSALGVDIPLGVMALIRLNHAAQAGTIMAMWNEHAASEAREWIFGVDATNHLYMTLFQETIDASISQVADVALADNTWYLVAAGYDGTAATTGISLFVDGFIVASTPAAVNVYVLQEDTTVGLTVGSHEVAAGTQGNWFDGDIGYPGITMTGIDSWNALGIYRKLAWLYDI